MDPDVALALARWAAQTSAVLFIGSAGGHLTVVRAPGQALDPLRSLLGRRLARLAILSGLSFALACVLMLAAQVFSWYGLHGLTDAEQIFIIVDGTRWGRNWTRTAWIAGGLLAAGGVSAVWPRTRRGVVLPAALAMAFAVPLLGHGVTHGAAIWVLHALHVLGAGLWIGTLTMLALVSWALWQDDSPSPAALAAVLRAFSPIALVGGALLASTGAWIAVEHIRPFEALWEAAYGLTLLFKLAAVAVVASLGFLNWRRHRPAAGSPAGRRALRRAVRVELVVALAIVLGITAWLSGLPIPAAGGEHD
jgi:putative copper export protein